MISLPIVERELGIASRKIGSWLSRWIIAIAAVLFGGGWLLIASMEVGMMKGDIFFAILAWACFAYCLLAGLWTTTGTLTREKKDGTLGLLFLTDLRGYDVVLGKMITTSLKSFYGVLAVLPVLALPLLMGGVTNDQLWRTVCALMNILVFSLSLGMFFSALSWHTGRAIFWTFFSLLSVTMLPLFYLWSGGTSSALHFFSPGFAMANASASVMGAPVAGFVGYWSWLGGGLAVSAALLTLASWIIPYRWRETKLRQQTPRLSKRPRRRVAAEHRAAGSAARYQPGRLARVAHAYILCFPAAADVFDDYGWGSSFRLHGDGRGYGWRHLVDDGQFDLGCLVLDTD